MIPALCLTALCILIAIFVAWFARQLDRHKAADDATASDHLEFIARLRSLPPADWEQPRVPESVDEDESWAAFMDARLLADFIPTQRKAGEQS